MKTTKSFKIAAVSQNPNSFGLTGFVLVAEDGEAWEVGKCNFVEKPWEAGQTVEFSVDENGRPDFRGCELPRRLDKAQGEFFTNCSGNR